MQKSATNYFFFDNVTFPTLHFYLPFTHFHLISTLFQTQANVMCVFVCVHSLIHAMCVCVPRFPPPLPKNKRPDNYSSTTTYYVLHQKKKYRTITTTLLWTQHHTTEFSVLHPPLNMNTSSTITRKCFSLKSGKYAEYKIYTKHSFIIKVFIY